MKTTGIVCTAVMIFLGIYDAIVVVRHGVGCSISRWIIETGHYSPLMVFMFGGLFGHLFLRVSDRMRELITDLDGLEMHLDNNNNWLSDGNSKIRKELRILLDELTFRRKRK